MSTCRAKNYLFCDLIKMAIRLRLLPLPLNDRVAFLLLGSLVLLMTFDLFAILRDFRRYCSMRLTFWILYTGFYEIFVVVIVVMNSSTFAKTKRLEIGR